MMCLLRVQLFVFLVTTLAQPAHGITPKALERVLNSPDSESAFEQVLKSTEHDVGQLIGLLVSQLEKPPESGSVHALLGRLYLHVGQYNKAIPHFEKALRLLPKASIGPLGLAECSAALEEWPTAIAHFDTALVRSSTKMQRQRIYRKKLSASLAAGEIGAARSTWRQLSTSLHLSLFARVDIAEEITRTGQLSLALEVWTDLYKVSKRDLKLRLHITTKLGRILTQLGQTNNAIRLYEKALENVSAEHWSVADLYEGLHMVHRQAGSLPSFVNWLQKRKRIYPALMSLARIHEELGQDKAALATYREAVRRRPANSEAQFSILRLLKRLGSLPELEAEYKRLARSTSSDSRFDLELARLYFKQSDEAAAFRTLEKVVRTYGDEPSALEAVTELYVTHNAPEQKTVNLFNRLLRIEPDREDHAIRLGEYLYGKKKHAEAIRAWQRVLRIVPSKGRSHIILARVFAEHDLEMDASREYRAAIEANPKRIRYREAFANWLMSVNRYRDASQVWKQMLDAVAPDDYTRRIYARAQLVDTLDKHKMLRVSVRKWRANLTAKPMDPSLIALISAALFHQHRYSAAIDLLTRATNTHPKNVQLLLYLQEATQKSGRVSDALAVVIRLSKQDKGAAVLRLKEMSRSSAELYNLKDAMLLARLYAKWAPSDPEALIQLGDVQRRNHQYDAAAQSYQRAIMLKPDETHIRLRYSQLLEDTGQYSKLASQLTQIVRKSKNTLEIMDAGQQALRLPGVYTLEKVAQVLLDLTQQKPKRVVYRELLLELCARWIRRTDLSGRSESQQRWLKKLIERGIHPIAEALHSQNLAARTNALRILNSTLPQIAEPALLRLLNEHDRITRFQALVLLARIRAKNALTQVDRLVQSKERHISNAAVWSLGVLSRRNALAKLRSIASTSKRKEHIQLAALALGVQRQKTELEVVLQLHRTKSAQAYATWALGVIGGNKALATLIPLLDSQSDNEVAVWAVGAIGNPKAIPALLRTLLSSPKHRQRIVRWALHRCIAGKPLSDEAIATAYVDLPSYDTASFTVEHSLQRLLITPVTKAHHTTGLLERSATSALMEILEKGSTTSRLNALSQVKLESGNVIITTIPGVPKLALINGPQIGQALARLVDFSNDELQKAVLTALGAVGNAKSLAMLTEPKVEPPIPAVRAALVGLAKNPRADSTSAIGTLYARHNADWSIRLATALALTLKRSENNQELVAMAPQLLRDEYASIRLATLRAIAANNLIEEFQTHILQLASNSDDFDVQALAKRLVNREHHSP
jgi:tetratricopeptide (TPR) repeat protein